MAGGIPHPPPKETFVEMTGIPFGTTDWSSVEPTQHLGETGVAT